MCIYVYMYIWIYCMVHRFSVFLLIPERQDRLPPRDADPVVLSVDDDNIHQQLVSSMFRNGSYEAILFKSGKMLEKMAHEKTTSLESWLPFGALT